MSGIMIRSVTPEDAPALLAIYAPYVEHTAISFEYETPDLPEFLRRMRQVQEKYPYITAVDETGQLLGYAYTSAFVGRAAYDWSAETTIYLREGCQHRGVGRRLYEALEEISRAQHIHTLCACIGKPRIADEYLTDNSVEFHQHMGYRLVGTFYKSGYKFGRWYDMVWMEKSLGGSEPPETVIPYPLLTSPPLTGPHSVSNP